MAIVQNRCRIRDKFAARRTEEDNLTFGARQLIRRFNEPRVADCLNGNLRFFAIG